MNQGIPNTEQPDPSDVSVSQSVSVVSVKYSLSGERRRQLSETRQQHQQQQQHQPQQQQHQQHESQKLPDTSIPPPSPSQTTAATSTVTTATTAPGSKRETQASSKTTTTTTTTSTTELPFEETTMSHSQTERKQIGNISPSTTTTTTLLSSSTTTTTALPFNQPSHSVIESKTTSPTTTTTTHSSSFHHQKENDLQLAFSLSPSTKITASTTTASSPFDSNTKKLVPINHSSNGENFEVTTRSNVRTEATASKTGRPRNEEDETDQEFKEEGRHEEKEVESANADLATSTVRGEKALFTSFEMVKQQNRNLFETILNSTIGASITSTTSAATSRHTTTSRPSTTTTTTTTSTTTTPPTTKARLLTTTTAPQKIYLQEVEEITDIDEEEMRNSTITAAMETKALHSNVPPPRQLTTDEKVGVLQKTSKANLETTEATKMVVEYLEEAELARSFPSTKWNVYEDQVGFSIL